MVEDARRTRNRRDSRHRRRAAIPLLVLAAGAVVAGASAAPAMAAPAAATRGVGLLGGEAPVVREPTVLPVPREGWSARLVRVADNGDVLATLRPPSDGSDDPFPAARIVVWRQHVPHDLGEGRPVDLDVHGHVVADRDGVVLRWDRLGGAPRHLPVPADAVNASAADMNARGDVAGTVTTGAGSSRAVVWPVAGGVVDLGPIGDATSVEVLRLTDDRKVVGTAAGGVQGAFSWQWDPQHGMRALALVPGRPEKGLLPPATAVSRQGSYLVVGPELFRLWHRSRGIVAAVTLDDVDAMSASVVAVNDHGVVVGGRLDTFLDDDVSLRWSLRGGWEQAGDFYGSYLGVNDRDEAVGVFGWLPSVEVTGPGAATWSSGIPDGVPLDAGISERGTVAATVAPQESGGPTWITVWEPTPLQR